MVCGESRIDHNGVIKQLNALYQIENISIIWNLTSFCWQFHGFFLSVFVGVDVDDETPVEVTSQYVLRSTIIGPTIIYASSGNPNSHRNERNRKVDGWGQICFYIHLYTYYVKKTYLMVKYWRQITTFFYQVSRKILIFVRL